jgi:ATP-dependent DNA helicase RecG
VDQVALLLEGLNLGDYVTPFRAAGVDGNTLHFSETREDLKEIGVDVPNASVMVIESAERFGLSQLHQLRGRVGRGAEQSYCILMTGPKVSAESKERIATMLRTNDGFEIADADLRLRGPGDLQGTRQSGVMDLRLADLVEDAHLLQVARKCADDLLSQDPALTAPDHAVLLLALQSKRQPRISWSRIS